MIAIIAGDGDVHAARVGAELAAMGREWCVVDFRHLGAGALLAHHGAEAPTLTLEPDRHVDFAAVTAIWNRRPNPPTLDPAILDPDARRFCRREWAEALDGVLLRFGGLIVNPVMEERAAVKPRQLDVARAVGLRVPDTLVTNDAEAATAFVERHDGRVIHKALTAPGERLLDTRVWTDDARAALPDLVLAPTVLQELVDGPVDFRVTVVGERLFAVRIETAAGRSSVDSRLDLDARCSACELPEDLETGLRELMARLGLLYGTIDLKLTGDGEPVFLEVNVQGQFLYMEILSELPITRAMAELLAEE